MLKNLVCLNFTNYAVICAVGVVDDIIELDALSKLGGQVIAAGILVWFGIQYNFFYLPDGRVISENSRRLRVADWVP